MGNVIVTTAKTLALDLEGTLISNAMSQFPRNGLYDFLETCWLMFGADNIVMFTTVDEKLFREIAHRLYREKHVPEWFTTVPYINWTGVIKDLCFVNNIEPERVILVDDYEGYIHPRQRGQWIAIKQFEHPYEIDDELNHVVDDIKSKYSAS